jgi:D-aminopeptidase
VRVDEINGRTGVPRPWSRVAGLSANLTRVALNGVNMTEGSWNAAIAGHFRVPVIMMSGDDAAIEEVRKAVGHIEARDEAQLRLSLGHHADAGGLDRSERSARPRRAAVAARIQADAGIDAGHGRCQLHELHAGVRFRARDMVEASMIMTFLGEYRPDITP